MCRQLYVCYTSVKLFLKIKIIAKQCNPCSRRESQEGHRERIGRVVREGFLEKEAFEQRFKDENELRTVRRKVHGAKFQMAELKS